MKVLANRLNNNILQKIISYCQNSFIKKRFKINNILDIDTIFSHSKQQEENSFLLFLDQEKAFDRISHDFVKDALTSFNFSSNFIKIISNLYENQQAIILFNNAISTSFQLQRGVRQGDPLSLLLYIIAFELFLKRINTTLKGIRIKDLYIKTRAFADDIVIVLDNKDQPIFSKLLKDFEEQAGAKINIKKFNLLVLGKNTNIQSSYENFSVSNRKNSINFLGFDILNNKFDYHII